MMRSQRPLLRLTGTLPLITLLAVSCSDTGDTPAGADGGSSATQDSGGADTPDTGAPADAIVGDGGVDIISHATDAADWQRKPDAVDAGADVSTPVDVPSLEDAPADVAAPGDVTADVPAPIDTVDAGAPDAGPPPELPYVNRCTEPGGAVNVYDLQDTACPDHTTLAPGETIEVQVTGLVVTAIFGDQFFAQDPQGGPWSGISVFALNAKGDPFEQLVLGDRVTVDGSYRDYYGLSQIYATWVTLQGPGTPATPEPISDAALVATGGEWAEPYEGVLLRISGVSTVINTKPDCPHDFGEFMIDGNLRVDDMKPLAYTAHLGDELQDVTGVLNYGFGNYKLEPRLDADLDLLNPGGTAASKCIKTDCIEAADAPETGALVVTEIMADPAGEDAPREWVEIQNRSAQAILVAGLTLKDCAFLTWMVPLDTAVALGPGDFAVLGASKDTELNGGVDVDAAWGEGFYLPNGEGAVLIYDGNGKLVDQARYASYDPWDFVSGHSLELVDPAADNQAVGNWKAASGAKYGPGGVGTPGAPNSSW